MGQRRAVGRAAGMAGHTRAAGDRPDRCGCLRGAAPAGRFAGAVSSADLQGHSRRNAGCGLPDELLPDLLAARVSIIALHTALDAAIGGTNDVLLGPFDPVKRFPLEPLVRTDRQYKLVVFVPPGEVDGLRRRSPRRGPA